MQVHPFCHKAQTEIIVITKYQRKRELDYVPTESDKVALVA